MSRILPLMPADVIKVIDTIDVFSTKRDKVLRFGIDDIHVAREEEVRRLQHADLVVAIQEDERRELQELLPGSKVVTAGVDFDRVPADPATPPGRRVLLVASDNPMNKKGLTDFVRFAWPRIHKALPDAELLVVGKVGRALRGDVAGVTRLGHVADLSTLYREARVVINPAVAGTGLKIKTLEALVYLRPIVTWPSGTDGVAPELVALCDVVSDWYEFANRVIARLGDAASAFSSAEQDTIVRLTSPSTVYQEMTAALGELERTTPSTSDARL
jgi:hypothetical protein